MPARCDVELDVYSGMPNPTWTLSDADADRFMAELGALPRTSERTLSGGLGYRGLIVRCGHGDEPDVIHLQAGTVQIASGATFVFARDPARDLERRLLDTGRPYLDEDLLAMIERALG